MVGEILSFMPATTANGRRLDLVMENVEFIGGVMLETMLIHAVTFNLPVQQARYQRLDELFVEEVHLILRLLRLHMDGNVVLPNIGLPRDWPCNTLIQKISGFVTISENMDGKPAALKQTTQFLPLSIIDILSGQPECTHIIDAKARMLHQISNKLMQMPVEKGVRDAIEARARIQFAALCTSWPPIPPATMSGPASLAYPDPDPRRCPNPDLTGCPTPNAEGWTTPDTAGGTSQDARRLVGAEGNRSALIGTCWRCVGVCARRVLKRPTWESNQGAFAPGSARGCQGTSREAHSRRCSATHAPR